MTRAVILLSLFSINAFSQESVKYPILKKYFFDFTPFIGINDPVGKKVITNLSPGVNMISNSPDFGGGIQIKGGNNWYLRKGKFTGILRLTWLRLGIYGGEASGIILTPLHVGIGCHFQTKEKFSIEPMQSGGIVTGTDDILATDWVIEYAFIEEIKFNFNNFVLGLEYSTKPMISPSTQEKKGRFHYFGISIGHLLGKNKFVN
jgi:hypothetical protein